MSGSGVKYTVPNVMRVFLAVLALVAFFGVGAGVQRAQDLREQKADCTDARH